MKVIFLDIDGVLNGDYMYDFKRNRPNCQGYLGIGKSHVRKLSSIINQCNKDEEVKIVLTSSWKYDYEDYKENHYNQIGKYLRNKLKEFDIYIYETTTKYEKAHYLRGEGILNYLECHPQVTHYVILDDEIYPEYNNQLKEHFVHTDYIKGLIDSDVEKAISILNA